MEQVRQLTFFLDLAPDEHGVAVDFWRGATGYDLSPSRGDHGEFLSLLPPEGDTHLKVQRLAAGPSDTHLDLHVDDLDEAVDHAVRCGATLLARSEHAVLASPGGYRFCLVTAPVTAPSAPTTWLDGHRSRADQLCLDIAPSAYSAECDFWATLTGWPTRHDLGSEFTRLQVPAALGTRVLLQRLDQDQEPVRGHLDVATDDRPAEVRRLQDLGATPLRETREWTVLRPPAGPVLCVTDRDPETGASG